MAPSSRIEEPQSGTIPPSTNTDLYNNPYYLHSSDHAGLNLVSDRLDSGADFHSWRRSMRIALNVRNKLGFVDGTVSKPDSAHRDYGSWSRCNDMVTTWLLNSVSKKIGQSLLFLPTAEAIWKNLMSRFKQDDAPRIFEIEQRLSSLMQGSMDVTTYFTELVTLWEEYKNYVELPVCSCGKCECNAARLWEQLQHRGRVMKFLMGLNEVFEPTRRHILMLKPIPPIEDVFNLVTQDERQRGIKASPKVENVAFQSVSDPVVHGYTGLADNAAYAAAYKHQQQRPYCTHCRRTGHLVQKCYKLIGYPPGHKGSQPVLSQSGAPSQPHGYSSVNTRPQASQQPGIVANVVANPPSTLDLSQFSQDQVQSLIHHLTAHVRILEQAPPFPQATITESGVMAATSSAGQYSGLDDW